MEATDLKGNAEEVYCDLEHWEVPKDDAIGKLVRGWKKRHRGHKQVAGRHGEPKELTPGDCGSQRKLTDACKKMTCCARVVWHKRNIARKDCTRANVVQEIWRGRTLGRRHQLKLECSKGIRS
jgi:hypothetical protein